MSDLSSELFILKYIEDKDYLTSLLYKVNSKKQQIAWTTLCEYINKLETQGYVTTRKIGKKRIIFLTKKGKRTKQQIKKIKR